MANMICVDIYESGCSDDAEPLAAAQIGNLSVCLFSELDANTLQHLIRFLQTIQALAATPVTQH